MLLINGVFFPAQSVLPLTCNKDLADRLAIKRHHVREMFQGVISRGKTESGWDGEMWDMCGNSYITQFFLTPEELRFNKKYYRRHAPISYWFTKKEGNVWLGEWQGIDAGKGVARCIITEVSDYFFDETSLRERLGLQGENL